MWMPPLEDDKDVTYRQTLHIEQHFYMMIGWTAYHEHHIHTANHRKCFLLLQTFSGPSFYKTLCCQRQPADIALPLVSNKLSLCSILQTISNRILYLLGKLIYKLLSTVTCLRWPLVLPLLLLSLTYIIIFKLAAWAA